MKTITYILTIVILCGICSCSSQNISHSDSNVEFADEFFMNANVYYALKKYTENSTILIVDTDKKISDKVLTYNYKDLKIKIIHKKSDESDFFLRQFIVNKDLAFVVLLYRRSSTALCFYPVKSIYAPYPWVIEEITVRSSK